MRTQGAFFDIANWKDKPFTPEDVLDRFEEITDWTDAVFPDDVKVRLCLPSRTCARVLLAWSEPKIATALLGQVLTPTPCAACIDAGCWGDSATDATGAGDFAETEALIVDRAAERGTVSGSNELIVQSYRNAGSDQVSSPRQPVSRCHYGSQGGHTRSILIHAKSSAGVVFFPNFVQSVLENSTILYPYYGYRSARRQGVLRIDLGYIES